MECGERGEEEMGGPDTSVKGEGKGTMRMGKCVGN